MSPSLARGRRRAVLALAAMAIATGVAADAARGDVEPAHLQISPTWGTRVCDGYANYVAVAANFQTFGQGQYKFRYTIAKDGANRFYSPMQGPWNLVAWKWYFASDWNENMDVPSGAVLRAYLFKLKNGTWDLMALRTVPCFF